MYNQTKLYKANESDTGIWYWREENKIRKRDGLTLELLTINDLFLSKLLK